MTEFDRVLKILFCGRLAIHFPNLEMDLVNTVAGPKQKVFNIDESPAIVTKAGAVAELDGKCSGLKATAD